MLTKWPETTPFKKKGSQYSTPLCCLSDSVYKYCGALVPAFVVKGRQNRPGDSHATYNPSFLSLVKIPQIGEDHHRNNSNDHEGERGQAHLLNKKCVVINEQPTSTTTTRMFRKHVAVK